MARNRLANKKKQRKGRMVFCLTRHCYPFPFLSMSFFSLPIFSVQDILQMKCISKPSKWKEKEWKKGIDCHLDSIPFAEWKNRIIKTEREWIKRHNYYCTVEEKKRNKCDQSLIREKAMKLWMKSIVISKFRATSTINFLAILLISVMFMTR